MQDIDDFGFCERLRRHHARGVRFWIVDCSDCRFWIWVSFAKATATGGFLIGLILDFGLGILDLVSFGKVIEGFWLVGDMRHEDEFRRSCTELVECVKGWGVNTRIQHSNDNHYSLLTTHHSPLTTHYSQLTTHNSLLTTHNSLLTTHHSLLTIDYSLLPTDNSQLTTHYSPLTTDN